VRECLADARAKLLDEHTYSDGPDSRGLWTADNTAMTSWQEWLEQPIYSTLPPQSNPRKSDFSFSFHNPLLFFPFMPPPEPYFNQMFKSHAKSKVPRNSVRHHYHPFLRYPPYSTLYVSKTPLDFQTEQQQHHAQDHFYVKSDDELFMPKGKPGLMLSQNGLDSSSSSSPCSSSSCSSLTTATTRSLPDEISNLVFDLERDPLKPLPHITLDDSGFLKNEYDEMNDIMTFKESDLNDSGICLIDSGSSQSESPPPPPCRPTLLAPSKMSSPIPRRNTCQYCHKQYQSISGLKYHLKKAHNQCSAKFKAAGPNHPLMPSPSILPS